MGTLNEDLTAIKTIEDGLISNKVAKFAYTDLAYSCNCVAGVETYDVNNEQNIPVGTASVMKVNGTVLNKGYRAQASSVTRMLLNHFLGRLSYNLNKVNDNVANLLNTLISHRGTANGLATLDANAKVPNSEIPLNIVRTVNGVGTADGAVTITYSDIGLSSTAGYPLGTASAGTMTTPARADHVHPKPTYVECICSPNSQGVHTDCFGNIIANSGVVAGNTWNIYTSNYTSLFSVDLTTGVTTASCFCGSVSHLNSPNYQGIYTDCYGNIVAKADTTSSNSWSVVDKNGNALFSVNLATGVATATCFDGCATSAVSAVSAVKASCLESPEALGVYTDTFGNIRAKAGTTSSNYWQVIDQNANILFSINLATGLVTACNFAGNITNASYLNAPHEQGIHTDCFGNIIANSGVVAGNTWNIYNNSHTSLFSVDLTTGVTTASCFCGSASCASRARWSSITCQNWFYLVGTSSACCVYYDGGYICNKSPHVILLFVPDSHPKVLPSHSSVGVGTIALQETGYIQIQSTYE